jgi:peptidoglycan-associated lipoprotein
MSVNRLMILLAAGLVTIVVLDGCAKRPALTEVAAPAPTGVAQPVAPAAPAAPVAPAAPAVPAAPAPPPVAAAPAPPPVAPPPAVEAPRPKPEEFVARPEVKDVYFDFDKSAIRTDAADTLQASARWLRDHPGYLVLIEGHCDERGTNAYNLALGDRRAHAALTYLVSQGVAASRFKTISYGEERPTCTERAERCWSKNRRAHFLVKAE